MCLCLAREQGQPAQFGYQVPRGKERVSSVLSQRHTFFCVPGSYTFLANFLVIRLLPSGPLCVTWCYYCPKSPPESVFFSYSQSYPKKLSALSPCSQSCTLPARLPPIQTIQTLQGLPLAAPCPVSSTTKMTLKMPVTTLRMH